MAIAIMARVRGGLKISTSARGSYHGGRPRRRSLPDAKKWPKSSGGDGNLANKAPSLALAAAAPVLVEDLGR